MKKALLVSILFSIVLFIFMYPVILNITKHIPGFCSTDEPYGVIWSIWWFKYAFLHKISPGLINTIAYPYGISANFSPFFPLWIPIAKYIAVLSNEIVAYNSVILSTFILSGLTMYFLMFHLTKSSAVGIFSGLIYAFCPYHFVRAWQHFGTAQIQWMPLYLLFLFKLWENKKVKTSVLLGMIFALNYYYDVHYGYFLSIITVLFVILALFTKAPKTQKTAFIKLIFIVAVIGAVFIIPVLLPLVKDILKSRSQPPSAYSFTRPFEDLFMQSSRPLSYFLPFTEQPFFGNLTKMFVGSDAWGRSLTENNIFLGFIPLFLTIVAFVKRRAIVSLMKQRGIDIGFALKFLFFTVLVSWLFSQPPWWNIFGFKVYMPSYFMYKALPMFRAYVRFGIVVMLGVSGLAGFGLTFILNKFNSRKAKIAVVLLFCFFALYEFWSNPKEHTLDLSQYPRAYDWLREQKGDIAIAEYPLDIEGPNELYKFYQTKHGKKILNGTIPGTPAHQNAKSLVKLSSPETIAALEKIGIKYIFVHTGDYRDTGLTEDMKEIKKIAQEKKLQFLHKFDDIEVYQINKKEDK